MRIDVLCVGHGSYDLIFAVDHHPGADEKCLASGFMGAGGGPAANAAVTVARLGGKAAFAGYLGNDFWGARHFEEFGSEGVLTDWIARGDDPTPLSAILVKPDGKRTVVTHKAATPFLNHDRVDFSRVEAQAILFDGHEPDISLALAIDARDRNRPTVLDAGSVHRGTIELMPLCGYVVASEKFARDFCREEDPVLAARALARIVPAVAVTLGERGLVWQAGEAGGRISAYAVDAVDTTGAGDIFHGAFALRIARGESFEAALRYAGAAAALGCTKMGARPGIPGKCELDAFLKKSGG